MAKRIHFLGIGGSATSAIAAISQAQGYQVTGCDKNPFTEYTKTFDKNILLEGHSASHLDGVDILAVTPAIYSLDPNNEEIIAAKEQGIEVLTWQEFMGKYLEKDKFVIAVAGTHGKSTTTAMVGLLLEDAGLDPTVEVGAIVNRWSKNYRVGKSKYFVTEADEFNDNFLVSHPNIAIVTSIEMDHPEYFKNFEDYKNSFKKFLSQTKGTIITNLSDPGVKEVLAIHPRGGNVIVDYSKKLIDFPLEIPGQHNILNASAVFQIGLALGINPEIIEKSLANFSGTGRRFEKLGTITKALVYSDYAHHPKEIKVTLETAREKFPDKKITVIFQPHMFSRTHALFNDFVKVFQDLPVDQTFIMDIYPSREIDTGLVNSRQLADAISSGKVSYIHAKEEILQKLTDQSDEDQVFFFLGAGSIHDLAKELLNDRSS